MPLSRDDGRLDSTPPGPYKGALQQTAGDLTHFATECATETEMRATGESTTESCEQAPSLRRTAPVYAAGTIAAAAIPFLLLPVLTRLLSEEDYGVVSMFQALAAIAAPLMGLSLYGAAFRRYFDRDKIDFPVYVTTCLVATAASSIVVSILLWVFSGTVERWTAFPAAWLWTVPLSAGLLQLSSFRLGLWRAEMRPAVHGTFQVTSAATNICISLVLVAGLGLGWRGRIGGQVLARSAFGLVALLLLWRGGWLRPRVKREYLRNALCFALPLLPHTMSMWAIAATDRLFIVNMIGLADTGVYTVGRQLGATIALLQHAFILAWMPWLFRRLERADDSTKRRIVKITYLNAAGLLALAALLGLAAPYLLGILVGERFRGAASYVPWIAFGFAFNGIYKMFASYIFYVGKTYYLAIASLLAAAINVPLNYVLIVRNGTLGAAQATAIAFVVSLIFTGYFAVRLHPMPWLLRKRS